MGTTKISAAEIDTQVMVGSFWAITTGVVTAQEVLGASKHPPMRILRIITIDLTGATATNGSVTNGSTTMVTAVALNVAAPANVTSLTIISNTDVVPSGSALTVTTSGATDVILWLFEYENV